MSVWKKCVCVKQQEDIRSKNGNLKLLPPRRWRRRRRWKVIIKKVHYFYSHFAANYDDYYYHMCLHVGVFLSVKSVDDICDTSAATTTTGLNGENILVSIKRKLVGGCCCCYEIGRWRRSTSDLIDFREGRNLTPPTPLLLFFVLKYAKLSRFPRKKCNPLGQFQQDFASLTLKLSNHEYIFSFLSPSAKQWRPNHHGLTVKKDAGSEMIYRPVAEASRVGFRKSNN